MSQRARGRGVVVTAIAGLLAVGLAACGGGSTASEPTATGSAPAEASAEPIRIGASLPLTGEFSQPGQAALEGYQVCVEMVNQQGGFLGRPIELVVKDDRSDQNTVVSDYNALITQDNVDLLLGTFSSLLNNPASAVAEKEGMLFVEPAGGNPAMFDRGFKYLFFAQQALSSKQGLPYAEWVASLPEDQKPKTAAYPVLDDPFAGPVVEGAKAALEAAGVETVYYEVYAADTKNFDAIASAVKASNPDLVFHGAQFEDGIGLTRAMLKADFTPRMFFQTNAPSFAEQFSDGIGIENTEGIAFATSHHPAAATPGNAEFVAMYKEMFDGAEPPEDAADAFAACQVLKAAVEAVGNIEDQEAMADFLHGNTVSTILGDLSWDETGAPTGTFMTGQWQGGQAEIVLPKEAATAEIVVEWTPGS